jgi:hypothetical protein
MALTAAEKKLIEQSSKILRDMDFANRVVVDEITNADVLDTPLTGMVTTTATAIVATDTVVVATGKAQAQINDLKKLKSIVFDVTAGMLTSTTLITKDLGAPYTVISCDVRVKATGVLRVVSGFLMTANSLAITGVALADTDTVYLTVQA